MPLRKWIVKSLFGSLESKRLKQLGLFFCVFFLIVNFIFSIIWLSYFCSDGDTMMGGIITIGVFFLNLIYIVFFLLALSLYKLEIKTKVGQIVQVILLAFIGLPSSLYVIWFFFLTYSLF